jgi:antitoxin MazE
MAVTLQKWGNSVGVRLPKPLLRQVGLAEGSQVDVLVEGDHLVIRRQRPRLAELLAHANRKTGMILSTSGLPSGAN